MIRAKGDAALAVSIATLATLACAWHCAPYEWVLLALPAWLLVPRARPSALATRALVFALIATWVLVASVDAQTKSLGFAFHPALPLLCVVSAWLVRKAQFAAPS